MILEIAGDLALFYGVDPSYYPSICIILISFITTVLIKETPVITLAVHEFRETVPK
jgi:hypothetical protein